MAINRSRKARLDPATCGGLLLACAGVLGGLLMEGGRLGDVAQITAALIVLGGTLGAVMVATPPQVLYGAAKRLKDVFVDQPDDPEPLIGEMIGYATAARRSGILGLDDAASRVTDPFLRDALHLAVDGVPLAEIRNMMELQMAQDEHRAHLEARVFESAGGYAPTIGIIGAVLGLIQVMKNLANIEEVGHGIAVAFVATIYGVASANLFFLPGAAKIKARIAEETRRRELIVEGVAAIAEGLNPRLIRQKLDAFRTERARRDAARTAVSRTAHARAGQDAA